MCAHKCLLGCVYTCMHAYVYIHVCVHTCRSLFVCVVCMCVYSSLPLEGKLRLLLDGRTLGRQLA